MRILLIEPTARSHDEVEMVELRSLRSLATTLPILAALVPPQHDVTLSYEDSEVTRTVHDLQSFDMVGVTCQTHQVERTLELLRYIRSLDRPPMTVVGGPATVEDGHRLVLVLSRFADAVVVGNAYRTWPQLLADFEQGRLQKLYEDPLPQPVKGVPHARFDLVDLAQVRAPHVLPVITAGGCPRRCTFCSEFLYGEWQQRPVDEVVTEVAHYQREYGISRFCFRDDDFLVNPKRSRELLPKLGELGIEWACQTDFNLARHRDVLQLALESGMRAVSFGVESVREQNRVLTEKTFFTMPEASELLLELHAAGVETQANIIFGFDFDDLDVFDETVEFLDRARVSRYFPSILFPIPGTPVYEKLASEHRLLVAHPPGIEDELQVLFQPLNMSADELVSGYLSTRTQFEELDGTSYQRNYWLGPEHVVI